MKMKHSIYLLCLLFAACNSGETIEKFPKVVNQYDPSKPKEVTAILPTTGRIDDNFVIEGNLGKNVDEMRVYFDTRQALLLSTDGTTLHGIVPKQNDGYNKITVVLGEDSIITDFEFRYRQNQDIKMIAGQTDDSKRAHWDGVVPIQDGSLFEGVFAYLRGIAVVADNSILATEEFGSMRLISQIDEKVVTVLNPWSQQFGDGAVNKDRDIVYFQNMDNRSIFICRRTDGWVIEQIRPETNDWSGKTQGMTFGADQRYLYFRTHTGDFGRIDLETQGYPYEELIKTEPDGADITKICYSKVSDCFYSTRRDENGIIKVWQDKTTGVWKQERYAGFNGGGTVEGNRLTQAKFTTPTGLCTDDDGNLYVTCASSQVIMKVWLNSGYVEHVAGNKQRGGAFLVNGKPLDSTFREPWAIAMDDEGNFIILAANDGGVRKYSIE